MERIVAVVGIQSQLDIIGFAAGLLRPEVWPFWGLYGLWLILGAWRDRIPWREIVLVAGTGVLMLVLWFLPEYYGSGSALRAAERARQPNPDSAALAASHFLEVFRRSYFILTIPVYLGALLSVVFAWRRRGEWRSHTILVLAVVSTALMIAVAAMTEAGFAGNLRYVALPAAMVCIVFSNSSTAPVASVMALATWSVAADSFSATACARATVRARAFSSASFFALRRLWESSSV